MKKYLIVHMTNGEGYSEPTTKKVETLNDALNYVKGLLSPSFETDFKTKGVISFLRTDEEDTTERVTIFEIENGKNYLLSIYANCTEANLTAHGNPYEAFGAMEEAAKILTSDIETTKYCITGECESGKEGFHKFQII